MACRDRALAPLLGNPVPDATARPGPGRRGDALDGRGGQRLGTPAELLGASGGRLARAGPALLRLQREHGNRQVQQLVAAMVQRKPSLGPPADRYERAAELAAQRVADGRAVPGIEPVHGGAPAVDAHERGEIGQARGCGKPLPGGVRRSMEQAYGADFTPVRTHSDARADRLARSLDALAFTTGQDIFFRRGAYAPDSSAGRRLLAHELSHVMQQGDGTGRIQRYLFNGMVGRYKSLVDCQANLGSRDSGPLNQLRQLLVDYENNVPRNRLGPTNNNLLDSAETEKVRELLIDILQAVDRVLLDRSADLTEKERVAADRLRVSVQDEMKSVIGRLANLLGRQVEPSSAGREYLTDQQRFASWLAEQPIYRGWAWRGAGTCQQAAQEISEWLTKSLFVGDKGRVTVRAIKAIAPPQMGIERMPYVNHFVTVVDLESSGKVVIDPTMSQFLGCGRPMIGDEHEWAELMRGSKANFGDLRYSKPSDLEWKDCADAAAALGYAPPPRKVTKVFDQESAKQEQALEPSAPGLSIGGLSRKRLVALSAFVVVAAIFGFTVINYAFS